MKILSREEFLKQPAGILYRKNGKDNDYDCYGQIEIKGDDPHPDPEYADFVCADFGGMRDDKTEEMEDLGESYPLQTEREFGRDGCFEREATFLVYETWDLEQMRKQIDDAIKVAPKQVFDEPWKKK